MPTSATHITQPESPVAGLDDHVATKLGRCVRCMRLSGVLLVASWLLVAGLALTDPVVAPLLGAAIAVAIPLTLLSLAHAVAYALRTSRAARAAALAPISAPPDAAQQAERGGCGCGGSRETD